MVVPVEELLAETAGILDGPETVRIIGTILHGFEVSFRKRIVIGNVRTTVSLDDAEVGQHLDLPFFQQHADRPGVLDGLQIEREVARLPDGAGDKPFRRRPPICDCCVQDQHSLRFERL